MTCRLSHINLNFKVMREEAKVNHLKNWSIIYHFHPPFDSYGAPIAYRGYTEAII